MRHDFYELTLLAPNFLARNANLGGLPAILPDRGCPEMETNEQDLPIDIHYNKLLGKYQLEGEEYNNLV